MKSKKFRKFSALITIIFMQSLILGQIPNMVVHASPDALTISVTDSSNQSIPQYTNSGGTRIDKISSTPVRLATDATANIVNNSLTNVTSAKYQFVTTTQFPNDSTMTNINLPAPNSQAAYANDLGTQGYITTNHYQYNGNPSNPSQPTTRDVSFGTSVGNSVLVQKATSGNDLNEISGTASSNAFLNNVTAYTDSGKTIKDIANGYFVTATWSRDYFKPKINAAWKAMKLWGYFSPKRTGSYILGSYSDDGAYGYIIANGVKQVFVNDWSIAAAKNRTSNNSVNLQAGKYYPIYMEWYEGNPTNAAFVPVYKYNGSSNWTNIPQNEFYSSNSTTPGQIPDAYFGDLSGIPFPTQDGTYYIATKFVSNEGTTSGLYGPFIIDTTPPKINSLSVISDNSSSNKNAVAGNKLTINFTASEALQANPQILINGYVANATYTNVSGNNYTATVNIGDDASIDSSSDKITQGFINVQIAHYSDLSGNVGSPVQDNSVKFISNTSGITLSLTQNPTTSTNGNVVVTATATASGSGNSIKIIKYGIGNQLTNYFALGGTSLPTNSLPPSKDSNGIPQSPVQSTFNVNTNGFYTVYTTDNVGNVAVQTINIENIFVPAPVITSPASGVTNNNKPTITGTGEAGATVTVYDGETSIGTATVDSNGNWSLTVTTALSDGKHVITATQTDAAGNVSPSSSEVNLTIDTAKPATPVITSPASGVTNNNKPTIKGTGESGVTVTVYDGITSIGTATVDSNGNWSLAITTALTDGAHAITATQTDAAGNVSDKSNTVNLTIDTEKPAAPVITSPASGATNNNKPTITGTGEAGATVTVYDGTTIIGTATVDSNGTWSLAITTALTDGAHAITATQTDAAGNVSDKSNTVNLTIDTAIPAAPKITGPADGTKTNNNKPTITGTGEAGAIVTVYDGTTIIGTATVDSNGNWSLTVTTALSDGAHEITATQTDAAGNVSPSSSAVSLTIDTAKPIAPVITSPESGATNNNKPRITGTGEAGATVIVYDGTTIIGTATVDSNGNWSLTVTTALSDGAHEITATQTDAAGNVSDKSNTVNLTIDTAKPAAPKITGPADGTKTNNNKPTITGTGESGATVMVYDGTTEVGTATVDSNGTWSLPITTALTDGAHEITATQKDAAGNVSDKSNTVNLTIVLAAPVITAPADGTKTSNNEPTITGTGEQEETVTVYDGVTSIGTTTVNSDGTWSLTPGTALTRGAHTITATQTDAAGNVSDKSNTVNLTIVPAAPVITAPADGTKTSNEPTITGTGEVGATVTVYDRENSIGTAVVGSNGTWSLIPGTALTDGAHVITATQKDAAENVSDKSNTVNLTITSTVLKKGIFLNGKLLDVPINIVRSLDVNIGIGIKTMFNGQNVKLQINSNSVNITGNAFDLYEVTDESNFTIKKINTSAITAKTVEKNADGQEFTIPMDTNVVPTGYKYYLLVFKMKVSKSASLGEVKNNTITINSQQPRDKDGNPFGFDFNVVDLPPLK